MRSSTELKGAKKRSPRAEHPPGSGRVQNHAETGPRGDRARRRGRASLKLWPVKASPCAAMSDAMQQHENQDDDQDGSDAADAAVPVAIAISAEAPAEAAGEKD